MYTNQMGALPRDVSRVLINSICEQLSAAMARRQENRTGEVVILFFECLFVCFLWSVQMYKLHQNERANTHTQKHTLIDRT